MQPNLIRILFAFAYLTIDLIYVVLSKAYYEKYAIAIQGSGFPFSRLIGAVLAYTALVIGWWFFAIGLAQQFTTTMHPLVAGALAGAIYGFVVYGVFNGTMYVMFKKYDSNVLLRDLLWGMTSASVITGIYMYIVTKK